MRISSRNSEPEPDLTVVRGEIDDYEDRHPDAQDVALIVEIAKSGLAEDRKLAETYGGGGIATYWIVNLVQRQLELYARPNNGSYPPLTVLKRDDFIDLILDDQIVAQIRVSDLLPGR